MFDGSAARKIGYDYEKEIELIFRKAGYLTRRISGSVDFGVDIIASKSGEKDIAIQCKSTRTVKAAVKSVQEVYAGGRYYDIERFVVVCNYGFTANAKNMASRLGVYLFNPNDGEFCYPKDIEKYACELIPICEKTKPSNRERYTVDGLTGTLTDLCRHFNVLVPTVRYRMDVNGMSIEDAIFSELKVGRPRKNSEK